MKCTNKRYGFDDPITYEVFTMCCIEHFACISSLIVVTTLKSGYCYYHFIAEETEARQGKVIDQVIVKITDV